MCENSTNVFPVQWEIPQNMGCGKVYKQKLGAGKSGFKSISTESVSFLSSLLVEMMVLLEGNNRSNPKVFVSGVNFCSQTFFRIHFRSMS